VTLRVILADDEEIVRRGIKLLLRYAIREGLVNP